MFCALNTKVLLLSSEIVITHFGRFPVCLYNNNNLKISFTATFVSIFILFFQA